MIKLLRIDERLIHGQIVTGWSKLLNITGIVVANDKAANDSVVTMTLKMAAPQGIKVAIKSVIDAVTLLNDPRANSMSILVLVDNPVDAYYLATNVNGIPEINIGNFGRKNKEEFNRKNLSMALFANVTEINQFKKLLTTNIPCNVQMTASEEKENLSDLI